MRTTALALACAFAGALAARDAPAATAAAKVEARGVQIVGETYGEGRDILQPFNSGKGTTVALLVTLPSGGIVEFDRAASKLAGMADDAGTDLLKKKGARKSGRGGMVFGGMGFEESGFGMMPELSKDGKACLVEAKGPGVPRKGAGGVRVSGTMVLKVSGMKKTARQSGLALRKGAKVTAGPVPFTVSEVGKPKWGTEPLQVTLHADRDISAVAKVRFLDAGGKEIETSDGGTSRMGGMGKVSVEKAFRLARKVDSATIEITYWADMKTLEVPFDLKVSMGL
ncbi:MAG: hypothetical protein ACYS9X_22830 [Planctomycetota bacterium]|jgi:hypothetical protein